MADITDDIHYYKGFWYFWDKTYSQEIGPFKTKQEAEDKYKEYNDFFSKGIKQ